MNPKRIFSVVSCLCAVVLAGGCKAPEGVRYVDPNAPGKVAGTGIESQDVSAAAQKAAQSILALPRIAQAPTPPRVIITPVTNRSATPVDTELYTMKLRGILMQYGDQKVQFLARDVSWATNKNEEALRAQGEVQPGAPRQAATYEYLLTAELRGISASSSAGRSEYFLLAFKLVDYNDILVWENQYEIKKEGNVNTIYR
jgi:hypothetical protein